MTMANEKQIAAQSLQNFIKMFKPLLAIVDDLNELGSTEQAIPEAKVRLDAIRAEEEVEKTKLAMLKAEVASVGDNLANMAADRDAARSKIETEMSAASKAADIEIAAKSAALQAQAEDKAAAIISRAEGSADKLTAGAKQKLAALQADISAATTNLADLQAKIDAGNASVAGLTDRFSAAIHAKFGN